VNNGSTPITATYTVTATAGGCSASPTTSTFTITVNPGPVVTITPTSQTVCNGTATNQVTFSSTVTNTTFTWTRDNTNIGGPTSGTGNVPSFIASTGTATQTLTATYTVVSTVPTGCGTSTQTFTISVNPTPKVQLTGTQNVCSGSPGNLTVTYQGTGPLTFSYTANGTATTTLTAPSSPFSFSVTPVGNTTYKIVSANDSRCTSLPVDISPSTAVVTVKPLPTATVQAGADQTICQGSSATIPIVFTGGAPYTLTYSDGTSNFVVTSVGNIFSLTVTPTTTTTYTLISVTDAIPCTGNVFGNAVITVSPTTVGGTAGPNQYFCSATNSGSVTLSGQTGTVVKWQRSVNGGGFTDLAANTTTTQSFSNLAAGTYQYRAVVQSGVCGQAFSNPATITVNVIALTSLSFTSPTCNAPGNNGQATIQGSGGTPPLSYTLSGGTLGAPVTNFTGIFTGLGAGTYTYTITDATPCTGVTGNFTITAPTPVVLAPLTKQDVGCFGGVNGTLTASASGGTGTKTYAITGGPVTNTTGQTSGVFTGLSAGTYTVQATDASGCTSNTQSITINQPAQTQPYDVNLAADATNFTFINPTVTFTDIVYSVFMNAGNAATNDIIYVRKVSGYTYSYIQNLTVSPIDGATLDNPRWSFIQNPSPITYPGSANSAVLQLNNDPGGVNQIPCGGVAKVSIRLTRNTTNNSTFTVTARNFPYTGEDAAHQVNNSANLGFSAQ
jgi:hypothetical protein